MSAVLAYQGQFRGRLVDLLREFITSNVTGRLSLQMPETRAEIFIRTGWVIHAQTDTSSGSEALFTCLDVEFADYQFESGLESQTRTIVDSFSRIAVGHTRKHPTHVSGETQIAKTENSITVTTGEGNNSATEKPITANMLTTLTRVAIEALGPAGGLVLEDAAAELGWELVALPQQHLPTLLETLGQIVNDPSTHARLETALKKAGLSGAKS